MHITRKEFHLNNLRILRIGLFWGLIIGVVLGIGGR